MTAYENLNVRDEGTIRIVSIDRPHCKNAVDGATATALYRAFLDFEKDETASVAILTGEEGTFCAGADLKKLAAEVGGNPIEQGSIGSLGPMGPTRLCLSKPVIAAVEGHAVAGGMELALWCDLRIMAEDATFGIYCRRFGVPLVDMGTVRLPRLIGQSRALDLILTGRPVPADEALQIGLANRITKKGQSLKAALELAQQISRFPQVCLRNDRRSVYDQWHLSHEEALSNELELGLQTVGSGETVDGASRFSGGTGRHGIFEE